MGEITSLLRTFEYEEYISLGCNQSRAIINPTEGLMTAIQLAQASWENMPVETKKEMAGCIILVDWVNSPEESTTLQSVLARIIGENLVDNDYNEALKERLDNLKEMVLA